MVSRYVISESSAYMTLLKALEGDRMHHAYLLTGPEGSGKTAIALHFAFALLCRSQTAKPCFECASCKKIMAYSHPDFRITFPFASKDSIKSVIKEKNLRKLYEKETGTEADTDTLGRYFYTITAKNIIQNPFRHIAYSEDLDDKNKSITSPQIIAITGGRDEDREPVTGEAETLPNESACKVFIITDIEKISKEDIANKLLKTLEEPGPSIRFFLTTSKPSALLATIRSRCQEIPVPGLEPSAISRFLREHEKTSSEQAEVFARLSDGSLHNAYDLIDDETGEIRDGAMDILAWFLNRNPMEAIDIADRMSADSNTIALKKLRYAAIFLVSMSNRATTSGLPETDFTIRLKEIVSLFPAHLKVESIQRILSAHEAIERRAQTKITMAAMLLSFCG